MTTPRNRWAKRAPRFRGDSGKRHAQFAAALLLLLVGAAGALLASLPAWQVLTTRLSQRTDVLHLSGRTVDSASTALALVALAGVVAVLATRGLWRRAVGAVLIAAGIGLVWRGIASAGAIDSDRARALVESEHETVSIDPGAVPQIDVHTVWPVLSVLCAVLVVAAGGLIALRGAGWQGMSSRYEAAPDRQADRTKAAASLWSALDRGEDPTSPEAPHAR